MHVPVREDMVPVREDTNRGYGKRYKDMEEGKLEL
jgi:hypothetical protein